MLPMRPRFAARLVLVVVGGLGHEGSPLLLQLLEVLVEVLQQVL